MLIRSLVGADRTCAGRTGMDGPLQERESLDPSARDDEPYDDYPGGDEMRLSPLQPEAAGVR
jgi:hypothetical protein